MSKIRLGISFFFFFFMVVTNQGPVVRKPIDANPRLKVNRGLKLASFKCF